MPSTDASSTTTWLFFTILTLLCWGFYGVLLHSGQSAMQDPVNGRYKAFLLVGLAYFLTAIVGPVAMMMINGASWDFTTKGVAWSFLAGVVGSLGAFGVLLAFATKGSPTVVMSIVFAGAPLVNAVVAFSLHPPADGLLSIRWPFLLGVLLAALGGFLVSLFRP